MEVIYLIGNGFDLSIGLETAPKPFLKEFIEKSRANSDYPQSILDLAEDINHEGLEKWSLFEEEMGLYSSRSAARNQAPEEYVEACSALCHALY